MHAPGSNFRLQSVLKFIDVKVKLLNLFKNHLYLQTISEEYDLEWFKYKIKIKLKWGS